MGDRTNPIKFGPEWLRDLAQERSVRTNPGAQASGTGAAAAPPCLGSPAAASRPSTSNPTTSAPKVLLARQRYGREEMLALYDPQTIEAPTHLKNNDVLYITRGQPPYALHNTMQEDPRDNMARQPPPGSLLGTNDRYAGSARGRGNSVGEPKTRGIPLGDSKGKSRGYNRSVSSGRGWHGNSRSGYNSVSEDDPNHPSRSWSNSHPNSGLRPNNGEQPDWHTKPQPYRMKRQTNTNWRQQQGREEGEEWRSSDGARRPQEKWEWGWQPEPNNRPNHDKWHNSRRTWGGGEGNDDALPEWAVDNAEACGGTFDSSGAFHGYSNDDSNIPKNQETPYPLVKSHTHGSIARNKVAEEGSEEWWASEKAKKLSPKRFDANELQFKKSLAMIKSDEKSNTNPISSNTAKDSRIQSTGAIPKRSYQKSGASTEKTVKDKPAQPSANKEGDDNSTENKVSAPATEEYNHNKTDDSKEKTFDQRPNSEKQNEKGNFQSVILTSNNTLRQKHQNIVVTPTETPKRQPKLMQYMETTQPRQHSNEAGDFSNRNETESDKIVEDILQMSLEDGIPSATINQMLAGHSNSSMESSAQVPYPSMQMRMASTLQGLNPPPKPNTPLSVGMQPSEAYNGMMQQPIGMTNSMLNASLGLPMPNSISGIPPSLSNPGLPNPNARASGLQIMGGGNGGLPSGQVSGLQSLQLQGLQGFGMPSGSALQNQLGGMPNSGLQTGGPGLQSATSPMSGMPNNSLFNNAMQHGNDLTGFGNNVGDPVATLHRLQQLASQRMNNAMYNNMMSQPPPPIAGMGIQQIISDQWYYEDPNNTIQGPFSSKEMYNWFRAGFFSPTLMVRRECEAVMRPLGTYGPMPFGPMDLIPPYPMAGGFDLRPQQAHDNLMNSQPGLGIDGLTSKGYKYRPPRQPSHFAGNVRYNPRNQAYNNQIKVTVKPPGSIRVRPVLPAPAPQSLYHQLVQNNKVQSLWGQPTSNAGNPDHMWMQAMNNNPRNQNPINNLPMYFWDNQPTDLPAAPLLPETIKTEEEILAQMRGPQAQGPTSPLSFFAESPVAPPEVEANIASAALHVNQLHKLIQKDTVALAAAESAEIEQQVPENPASAELNSSEMVVPKGSKVADKSADAKPTKEVAKVESKAKGKETAKLKSKKTKDEKKEVSQEVKAKEEEVKVEKRSAEPSPSPKHKKDDKAIKKELDKEKKEWIKEGFTIVKGVDKSKDKEMKKKAEELKAFEEAERKRQEEELFETEEKQRQMDTIKLMLDVTPSVLPARRAVDLAPRKAPWSASSQAPKGGARDGPTLAEIQRHERERKLVQMREQQHMMQLIAEQQAAALAREQEVQATLGWAKTPSHSMHSAFSEIQAETRKQTVAAVAREEAQFTPPPVTSMPWSSSSPINGGGFWDAPLEPYKPVAKPAEPKAEMKTYKKRVTVMPPPKPEMSPSVEFDTWCSNMLISWQDSGIDVPTFVSFLRDIESPYEVKDYVKCYLGDTRDSSDFARQFLEKRSRLLRVGMVTPSDDLCSPAMAVNPRTASGSDHAELKAKGKKTKKNKMLKVDARNILGFSVTASEDRINVGDIDTV